MCKKCICLCRVSTNAQDLEGQREKVVANAIADGYTMDEIAIVEKKESAINLSEMERESLNEMKEIINDNPSIESVYVFAIDRLARKVSIVLSVKDYLTERGINLVFLNPHKMGTLRKDNGKMVEDELTSMLLMFLSYGSEMEMKIKKERFAAAKAVMQKQKKLTSGKPVFGYKKNADGTISVNEEEAAIVRQIYYEVLHNNQPIKQIEREMIAKGFIKPKKVVTGSSVRYYCANKAYYGSTTTFGSIMEYPPIITKEEFEAMQKKMAENRKGAKKNTKQTHLCKGILRNQDSNLIMIYNASSRSYVDYENHQNINAVTMDFIAWYIAKTLHTISLAVQSDTKKEDYKKYIEENNTKISTIQSMMSEIENRQRKAFKMYLDGKVSESIYDEQIDQINKEINNWNAEIAKLESENKRMILENEERENKKQWDSKEFDEIDDPKTRKEIINEVIEEIKVIKLEKGTYDITVIPKNITVKNIYAQLDQHFTYNVRGRKITLLEKTYKDKKILDITGYIKSGETPTATIYSENVAK